jgi:hypothetical protein
MLIRSDESVMVGEATIAFTFERLMQPLVVVEGDPVGSLSPSDARSRPVAVASSYSVDSPDYLQYELAPDVTARTHFVRESDLRPRRDGIDNHIEATGIHEPRDLTPGRQTAWI